MTAQVSLRHVEKQFTRPGGDSFTALGPIGRIEHFDRISARFAR